MIAGSSRKGEERGDLEDSLAGGVQGRGEEEEN